MRMGNCLRWTIRVADNGISPMESQTEKRGLAEEYLVYKEMPFSWVTGYTVRDPILFAASTGGPDGNYSQCQKKV